jgi:hypothetical protein
MKNIRGTIAAVVLGTFLSIGTFTPFAAKASEAGRRNTTYALGALTGVLALKHQWIPAGIAAVGTGVAYHNYQAAVNARHRREHQLAYAHAYRSGYYSGDAVGRRTAYRYAASRNYGSVRHHYRVVRKVHHRRLVHHRRHHR